MLNGFCFNSGNIRIAHQLVAVACRGIEALLGIGAHLGFELLGDSEDGGRLFLLTAGCLDIVLERDKTANLGMTKENSIKNNLFGEFICPRFNHHHGIIGTCHRQIEFRHFPLCFRRIDDK